MIGWVTHSRYEVVHQIAANQEKRVAWVVAEARFWIGPKTASEDCVVPF